MNLESLFSFSIPADTAVSIPLALTGGAVSAFNPCCMAMIPSMAILLGQSRLSSRWKGFFIAALFVFGFATAMAVMGALTTGLGLIFGQYGQSIRYIATGVLFFMGFNLLGIFRLNLPALHRAKALQAHGGPFVIGFLFTFVVAPCSTPILASILAYAAVTKSVGYGSGLLFVYGVGAGIPLIVTGSFMGSLGILKYVEQHRKRVDQVTAITLMLIGIYLIWSA